MDAVNSSPAFNCARCGNCCRVPGYVRLEDGEPELIAAHMGLDVLDFTGTYTRLTRDRRQLSLIEKDDGACILLQDNGLCAIQPVKPAQCLDFPHIWRFAGWEDVCCAVAPPERAASGELEERRK